MTRQSILKCRVIPLLWDDVDTDQIVPARFLTTTTRQGLKNALFAEHRARARASGTTFIIDDPEHHGATALLAGRNFGCGSSREHAVWALAQHPIRVILARSFGEIFRINALKNGLLPIELDEATHATLSQETQCKASTGIHVDLEMMTVTWPPHPPVSFRFDPFYRHCLIEGRDVLDHLISKTIEIDAYEKKRLSEQNADSKELT